MRIGGTGGGQESSEWNEKELYIQFLWPPKKLQREKKKEIVHVDQMAAATHGIFNTPLRCLIHFFCSIDIASQKNSLSESMLCLEMCEKSSSSSVK
jgi:hypothetical protein